MFVERLGHGPDLLLLHGWGLNGSFFAPLVERLAHAFTVHSVDLPGHGRSVHERFEVEHTVQELTERFPHAHVVGWSLGGLLAQRLRHTASRTLIATSAKFTRDASWPQGVDSALLEAFASDLASDFPATMARFVELEVLGSSVKGERAELLSHATKWGPPSVDALQHGLQFLRQFDQREAIGGTNLWIGGARDRMIRPQAVRASAALSAQSRAMIVPGAGHAPFITHPDIISALIIKHALGA